MMKLLTKNIIKAPFKRIISLFKMGGSYGREVWWHITQNGMIIRICDNIYSFNTLESLAVTGICSLLIGVGIGLFISGLFYIAHFLNFHLKFKRRWPTASWDDYTKYSSSPLKYQLRTRGGVIDVRDIVEAIDVDVAIDGAIPGNHILKRIKDLCFKQSGFYTIQERFKVGLKRLHQLQLITWKTIGNNVIGFVSLDALLTNSLPRYVKISPSYLLFGLASIKTEIILHEFSVFKLIFNTVTLAATAMFLVLASAAATSFLILRSGGLIAANSQFSNFLQAVMVSSGRSVIASSATFGVGLLVPPFCSRFGEFLPEGPTGSGFSTYSIDGKPVVIDHRFNTNTGYGLFDTLNTDNGSGLCTNGPIADTDPKISSEFTPLPELGPSPRDNSPTLKRKSPQVGTYGSLEESNRHLFEDAPSVEPSQMPTYRKVKSHVEGVLDNL